ncbi:MAG: DNA adenine methylase [Clostridia bacterium]|nr:DNA adenine methylase [Clostridia bacterium]
MSDTTAILKYPGGKWRIADWIISHLPPHKVYLEPFFGSGGVFFKKEPSYLETINDINGDIVNLFKVCRERQEELAQALEFTPWARDEYVNCKEITGNEVERARRFLVRHHQSFGTTNSNLNTWRHSQSYNSPRCAEQWCKLPETVLKICERLKMAQIENKSAFELIESFNNSDTLIYLDPPYLQRLRKRNMYKFEMTDKEHVELLALIKNSNSKICLSAYDNELYNEALKGWFTAEKKTTAQMGKIRTEKLYMNYQPNLLSFGG